MIHSAWFQAVGSASCSTRRAKSRSRALQRGVTTCPGLSPSDDAPLRFGSGHSTTLADCGQAKYQEEWLTNLLNDSPNIGFLHGKLVIRAGDRRVELDESTTKPEEVLVGRSWQVTAVVVQGQLNRVRPEDMLTIRFEADGTFETIAGPTSIEGRVRWGRGWLRAEWSGRGGGVDSDFPSPDVHFPEGPVTVEQDEGHVRLVSDRPYALELTPVEEPPEASARVDAEVDR